MLVADMVQGLSGLLELQGVLLFHSGQGSAVSRLQGGVSGKLWRQCAYCTYQDAPALHATSLLVIGPIDSRPSRHPSPCLPLYTLAFLILCFLPTKVDWCKDGDGSGSAPDPL